MNLRQTSNYLRARSRKTWAERLLHQAKSSYFAGAVLMGGALCEFFYGDYTSAGVLFNFGAALWIAAIILLVLWIYLS